MYLSLTQIAESFGVSETVVQDWMRNEGLPHTPDGGRILFDRGQVVHWATLRGHAAKAGFLAPATPAFATRWHLEALLRSGGIWRDIPSAGVIDVFRQIVTSLPGATPAIRRLLAERVSAKDGVAFAPIGGGFAVPHLGTQAALGRESCTIALLLLKDGLAVGEPVPDDIPIRCLFFFMAPSPRAHLDFLGRLCRLLGRAAVRELILRSAPDEEIYRAVAAADEGGKGGGNGGGEP